MGRCSGGEARVGARRVRKTTCHAGDWKKRDRRGTKCYQMYPHRPEKRIGDNVLITIVRGDDRPCMTDTELRGQTQSLADERTEVSRVRSRALLRAHETLTTTKPGCYRPRVIPKLRKLYRRTGVGLSNDVPMEGCATAVAAAAA